MKKNTLRLLGCMMMTWLLVNSSFAQTRPRFSQHLVNHFLINPAATGAYGYNEVNLMVRNQWLGLEDSPRAVGLSGQFTLNLFSRRLLKSLPTIGTTPYTNTTGKGSSTPDPIPGVGILFYLEENGNYYRRQTYFNIGMPLKLTEKITLSLGTAFGLIDLRRKEDGVGFLDNLSVTSPHAEGSFLVYSDDFYGGFSAGRMYEEEASLPEIPNHDQDAVYYHITGGYRWRLNENWQVIPTAQVRIVEGQGANVNLSARAAYKEKSWAGIRYQEGRTIALLAGKVFGQFELNYVYALPLSSLALDRLNNHEVTIKYRLGRGLYRFQHNLF